MVKPGWWSLDGEAYFDIFKWLFWVFPRVHFWLFSRVERRSERSHHVYSRERWKTWKISSCVMILDSLSGTARHVMKSVRPFPSPFLHTESDQKLDGSQGLGKSLLYQCVYLFKVEIASIRSTRLFSISHIQKTERRKVGLGLKVKVHRSIGIL